MPPISQTNKRTNQGRSEEDEVVVVVVAVVAVVREEGKGSDVCVRRIPAAKVLGATPLLIFHVLLVCRFQFLV